MTSELPLARPPLKVCHIVATTEGAAWVFEQLRELRDRYDYDVSAILSGDQGTLVDRFRAAAIPTHAVSFDFTSNSDLLSLPRKVLDLARLLARERFDVIQTHLFHSMVLGRIAAWFADVPVRFSMIAGPFHLEAYTPRWIDRYTRWIDTTTIASCDYTRTLYRRMGVPEGRLAVIYYGPDESKFDPSATIPANLRAEFGWRLRFAAHWHGRVFLPGTSSQPLDTASGSKSLRQKSGGPDPCRTACIAGVSSGKISFDRFRVGRGRTCLPFAYARARHRTRPRPECDLHGLPDRRHGHPSGARCRGTAVSQREPGRHYRSIAHGMSDGGNAHRRPYR